MATILSLGCVKKDKLLIFSSFQNKWFHGQFVRILHMSNRHVHILFCVYGDDKQETSVIQYISSFYTRSGISLCICGCTVWSYPFVVQKGTTNDEIKTVKDSYKITYVLLFLIKKPKKTTHIQCPAWVKWLMSNYMRALVTTQVKYKSPEGRSLYIIWKITGKIWSIEDRPWRAAVASFPNL